MLRREHSPLDGVTFLVGREGVIEFPKTVQGVAQQPAERSPLQGGDVRIMDFAP